MLDKFRVATDQAMRSNFAEDAQRQIWIDKIPLMEKALADVDQMTHQTK